MSLLRELWILFKLVEVSKDIIITEYYFFL
jgi:hypothetical protein